MSKRSMALFHSVPVFSKGLFGQLLFWTTISIAYGARMQSPVSSLRRFVPKEIGSSRGVCAIQYLPFFPSVPSILFFYFARHRLPSLSPYPPPHSASPLFLYLPVILFYSPLSAYHPPFPPLATLLPIPFSLLLLYLSSFVQGGVRRGRNQRGADK